MSYQWYPRYVSVAERKAKAEKKLKKLKKKNPNVKPVIIEGRSIAKTWWGKEWNKNLEKYADYTNRIGRGRSYVRHGSVLDLQIEPGQITSLVQGSDSSPYSVTIQIKEIPGSIWEKIKKACEGKLDSLQELLIGKFPKALGEIFTAKGQGLFPSPEQIDFSCTCPDWASMCKHVAATLYGIGARLDEEPALFFKLRKVEINDLISKAVEDKTDQLLKNAEKKTGRVMEDSNLSDVFGIDLEENIEFNASDVITPKKSLNKKKSVSVKKTKSVKKTESKVVSLNAFKKKKRRSEAAKIIKAKTKDKTSKSDISPTDIIADIIRKSKKGIGTAQIKEKTGFDERKIYNIIYKLKKHGKIKNVSWGIYSGV